MLKSACACRAKFIQEVDCVPLIAAVAGATLPVRRCCDCALQPSMDEGDSMLLRIDFIREVDELLHEVDETLLPLIKDMDMSSESVAVRLQVEERLRAVAQVRELRETAALLRI